MRPLPQPLVTGLGFHLVWPKAATLASDAQRVRDWLVAEFAAEGRSLKSLPPVATGRAGPRVRVSRRP